MLYAVPQGAAFFCRFGNESPKSHFKAKEFVIETLFECKIMSQIVERANSLKFVLIYCGGRSIIALQHHFNTKFP